MNSLRIGMGQIQVEGGNPAANMARGERTIAAAADAGCHAVVLPEVFDLGWIDESAPLLAEPIPGPRADRLAAAAASAAIVVVAGLTHRCDDDIYNASVIIDRDGTIKLVHHKINELDIGRPPYSVGETAGVAQTSIGTVGIAICADNFPGCHWIADSIAAAGARILLSPCAWAVPPDHDNAVEPYGKLWEDSYREIATRHGMAVVGVSNVGRLPSGAWAVHKAIGCSLAVHCDGEIAAKAPYGDHAEVLSIVDVRVREHIANAG